MKKIFAFDIDGTLLEEGKSTINNETIKAINTIKENGDIPILSTGRSYSQSIKIVEQLNLDTYLISSAGAMITNLKDKKDEILSKPSIKIVNYFLELCSKNKRQMNIKLKNNAIKYYFGNSPSEDINKDSLFWKKGGTLNPTYNKISNFYNEVNLDEVLQVSMKAEPELINNLYENVKKDIEEIDENFTVIIVSDVYLELTDKKWNKGTALEKIRINEEVDSKNVYVVGDSNNDIEMMKMFENSIAMGNSTNEVLSIASKVIGKCKDNGVANFINDFYNIKTTVENNNRKLFAFDLDGTLVQDNEVISDKVVEAIKIIKENGDIPIIATGRSYSRSKKIIEKLDISDYAINSSGGSTFDIKNNSFKKNINIPEEISKYFIDLAIENKRLLIVKFVDKEYRYYFGDDVYTDIPKDNIFWIRGDLSANNIMDNSNMNDDIDYSKIIHLAIKAEPEIILKIFNESKDRISEINSNFSIQIVSDVFADLKINNCNKATAIDELRNQLGISFENVYVFGDSSNDFDMISYFKNGIAMGNGTEEVKQIASKVIDSCDNDGVYKFIYELYKK